MPDPVRKNCPADAQLQGGQSSGIPGSWNWPGLFADWPVALAVLDENGRFQTNQACCQLLARTVSAKEGVQDRWLKGAATRLLASGSARKVLPAPNDHTVQLEISLSSSSENEVWVLGLVELPQAQSASQELAETVSTLSHELRTPLTSMKSSLNLVLAGEAGELTEDQSHFLNMTMRNIDRLNRLVSDLLDVSKADASLMNLRPEPLDAAEVARACVATFGQEAQDAQLELNYSGPGETVVAMLDRDKLTQMLGNLVGNAIKYTPLGGRIAVRARLQMETGTIRLEVQDTGPGMDPQTVQQALRPYQRAEAAENSSITGTGLGLPITRKMAEAMGGKLGLESTPGQGTLAWLELPMG